MQGAIGELEVGRLLDGLGPGWHAVHAVPVGVRGSDIDHLVIGPGGVFTVNSKHHPRKTIWLGSRRLLVNGQARDHLRNASFEASRVAKALHAALGTRVHVTPTIAIVGARRYIVREEPAVVVVRPADELVLWMRRRKRVLSDGQVSRLLQVACDEATWGSAPLPEPDLSAFARLREDIDMAWRRRQNWIIATVLVLPVALVVLPMVFFSALMAAVR